jgi:hypothetical protein
MLGGLVVDADMDVQSSTNTGSQKGREGIFADFGGPSKQTDRQEPRECPLLSSGLKKVA